MKKISFWKSPIKRKVYIYIFTLNSLEALVMEKSYLYVIGIFVAGLVAVVLIGSIMGNSTLQSSNENTAGHASDLRLVTSPKNSYTPTPLDQILQLNRPLVAPYGWGFEIKGDVGTLVMVPPNGNGNIVSNFECKGCTTETCSQKGFLRQKFCKNENGCSDEDCYAVYDKDSLSPQAKEAIENIQTGKPSNSNCNDFNIAIPPGSKIEYADDGSIILTTLNSNKVAPTHKTKVNCFCTAWTPGYTDGSCIELVVLGDICCGFSGHCISCNKTTNTVSDI